MSYLVIGGNPFRTYTSTVTYTGLYTVGLVKTSKEAAKLIKDNYDDCGGLISVFDTETGEQVDVWI